MRGRRGGFTFVEILTSMTIVAILAGIVIPKTGDFIKQARAAAIVADISAIHEGLVFYYSDSTDFPPSGAMGLAPAALANYLPPNFSFVKPEYQLQYEKWTLTTPLGAYPATSTIVAVTVQTGDARLGQLVMAQMAATPHFQSGDEYTFIIDGL
ncbi:MAG TPA: prepilin-type N-terminal cleavage/methylation domain-containing protein [Gemmatimonadaceae bacterium]